MNTYTKCAISFTLSFVLLFSAVFAAIPEGHWFESIAKQVEEAGFYPKVTDPSFEPDDELTYSQFAIMSTLAIGRAISYNGDLANEPIKRIDILKILNERLGYDVSKLSAEEQVFAAVHMNDFNDMSQDEKNVILAASHNGLIKGNENGEIRPNDNATYAEALTILSRIK